MKTILTPFFKFLALSLFLLLIFSCGDKEEETAFPSIAEQLEGRWTKSLIRLQYYNASSKMDYEDRVTEENGMVYEFNDGTLTITYLDGETFKASYKLIRRDGKDYVELSDGTDKVENEVVSISDDQLVWQDDYEYLEYSNGSSRKTAAKAVYIEEFAR